MAFGDGLSGLPSSDRSGVTFQYELRKSWNAPKSFVDFDSPGVVVLDTTVVPDVLGLHAFRDGAELVRVLPAASPDIVRVLVPDDCAEPASPFGDHSCRSWPNSFTGHVLRPPRRSNVPGTLVPGLFRRLSGMLRCLSDLLTVRRILPLLPGRLRAPRPP